jgi:hypothetical protein
VPNVIEKPLESVNGTVGCVRARRRSKGHANLHDQIIGRFRARVARKRIACRFLATAPCSVPKEHS